jgi:hypothetical protein
VKAPAADPFEMLRQATQRGPIPARVLSAGWSYLVTLDPVDAIPCEAVLAQVRDLYPSGRAARPVLAELIGAFAGPDGPRRAALVSVVLCLLDDAEGEVAEASLEARRDAARRTALASALDADLLRRRAWLRELKEAATEDALVSEVAKRLAVVEAAVAVLREEVAYQARHSIRPAPRREGRPARILKRDVAVRALRACRLSDEVARSLYRAASA